MLCTSHWSFLKFSQWAAKARSTLMTAPGPQSMWTGGLLRHSTSSSAPTTAMTPAIKLKWRWFEGLLWRLHKVGVFLSVCSLSCAHSSNPWQKCFLTRMISKWNHLYHWSRASLQLSSASRCVSHTRQPCSLLRLVLWSERWSDHSRVWIISVKSRACHKQIVDPRPALNIQFPWTAACKASVFDRTVLSSTHRRRSMLRGHPRWAVSASCWPATWNKRHMIQMMQGNSNNFCRKNYGTCRLCL